MPDPRIIVKRMQIADQRWHAAIEESAFAPPDIDFAGRLRSISAAAESEAVVLHEASFAPQLRWNPTPDRSATKRLSYELRPGGNRPGPRELWDRFDEVIATLARAMAGTDFAVIADGYRALGEVSAELADAVDQERGIDRGHGTGRASQTG
jgi:hypothetical protein